jgi:hypothetical protein
MASEEASALLGVGDVDVQRAERRRTFLRAALAAFSALGLVSPAAQKKRMPPSYLRFELFDVRGAVFGRVLSARRVSRPCISGRVARGACPSRANASAAVRPPPSRTVTTEQKSKFRSQTPLHVQPNALPSRVGLMSQPRLRRPFLSSSRRRLQRRWRRFKGCRAMSAGLPPAQRPRPSEREPVP